ncbi:MAG: ABC transporter ATP-binding protein [Myxococcota bacterium]
MAAAAERVYGASDPKYRNASAPPPRAWVDPDSSKGWFRRLVPVLAAHRTLILASLTGGLFVAAAGAVTPRLVMSAIDVAMDKQAAAISFYGWLLGGIALARFLLSMGFRYGMQKASQELEYDLRASIYEHLSTLSFGFYDRAQTGQLISRANADIRAVQMFLMFAPMMSITLVSFVAALGIMISINPMLTLVALVPIPGVYWMGLHMRTKLFPMSWLIQARMADVATIVEENVTGVRIVKSFAAERQQLGLLGRASERLRWITVKQVKIRAFFAPVMENLPRIGRALVLLYGGWLAIEGQLTIGALVAINMYMIGLQAPFRMIGFLMIMSQRAAASAQRIYAIFDERSEVQEREGAVDLLIDHGRVSLEHVSFGYGNGPNVIEDLSLTIEPGETVAVVGRTGSGKSTLMRLLPRFYDVREGCVKIDGVDVRDATLESLRTRIGLVLDEPFLFSESIHANIAYARPNAAREKIVEAALMADAHGFIDELPEGYDTIVGERGYTLSGGQRQRIAIARTLLADPRVLVLDDATSSVDVRVEQQIHQALGRLLEGRTTIVIAHRLSTIALADRVVLLDEGRIVADGRHEELLQTVPAYAEVLTREQPVQRLEPDSQPESASSEDDRMAAAFLPLNFETPEKVS